MNFGILTIWIALFASIGVMVASWRAWKRSGGKNGEGRYRMNEPSVRLALTALVALAAASIDLFALLLTHHFDYSYVARYSSTSQPLLYLVSAFWAGQEGTFLLWALLVAVMLVVVIRRARSRDYLTLGLIAAYGAFLNILMLVKSPFEMLANVPPDGSGMNPLLMDPWMAIHPPILFVGYAATVVPFALVVSALIRKDRRNWMNAGFAWVVFAALALGAGIIIGGFWAYEVLGWGGYWGWDPVENSSLVPWLVLLALIHGLLIERTKGALIRTNEFLAIASFVLVLYATFLTRSGVLADFSVHSFVDLGINNYLVGGLALAVAVGFGWFALRFRGMHPPKIDFSSLNREVALLVGLLVLCLGAVFTFFGMSSPLITGLFGAASQVETSFYNRMNLPVAIIIAVLLGITPFLGWTEEGIAKILKRLWLSFALTALACVIAYVAGVTAWTHMLLVAASVFGLVSNAIALGRQYRTGWTHLGGPLSHIGVVLLFIAIIGSGAYDENVKLALKQGVPQNAFGYNLTFLGITEEAGRKPVVSIQVSDGRTTYVATPKLYFSDYNQAMMREPDIKVLPLKDLYLSPMEVRETAGGQPHGQMFEITKGETKEIAGYQIEFVRFDVGSHSESPGMGVGAVLTVRANGTTHEVIPQLSFGANGERHAVPADLPPLHLPSKGMMRPQVTIGALNVDQKKIVLEILGNDAVQPAGTHELLVEVSTKPLMMVVWTGVILILAGTAIALRRRLLPEQA